MKLNSSVYDVLKSIAQIWLPAAGTLYFTLAQIWGLPAVEQVIGSVGAVDTFLGLVLGISTSVFNRSDAKYDGDMHVAVTPAGGKTLTLALNGDPDELDQKKDVLFKVVAQ